MKEKSKDKEKVKPEIKIKKSKKDNISHVSEKRIKDYNNKKKK